MTTDDPRLAVGKDVYFEEPRKIAVRRFVLDVVNPRVEDSTLNYELTQGEADAINAAARRAVPGLPDAIIRWQDINYKPPRTRRSRKSAGRLGTLATVAAAAAAVIRLHH